MDCYWYIKEEKMVAACVECNNQELKSWFWAGSEQGYGDYDLECSICQKIIHKRNNETKTAV